MEDETEKILRLLNENNGFLPYHDKSAPEEIYEFFREAATDSAKDAYKHLKDDDITIEEIELIRIKFLSDLGN